MADTSNDEAAEATRQLMNPSSSSETPGGEETIFEVDSEAIPEAAPIREPPTNFLAEAAVPPDIRICSPNVGKLPPLPPRKAPPTMSTPFARPPSLSVPDPFLRRRTKDSFQGSLESIDSLIESYWDPEEDGSLATPVATNIVQTMDFLEEHVDFLKVQTQPRSVEVVWETEDTWDADTFS